MKSITSAKKEIETFGVLLQHNFFGVEIANDIPFLSNPSSCVMKEYPIDTVKEFDDYQTKIEFFKDSKVLNTKSRLNLDDYFLPEYETNDTNLTHDEILEDIISFSRETMKFSSFVKTIKANGEVTRIYDCDILKNYKLEKDEEEYSSYSPICTTAFVGIDYLPIHCFSLLNQKYNTRFAFLTATATKELENALEYMGAKRFTLPGTFRKLDVLRLVKIRHIESIDEKGIRTQSVHSKIDFKPRKQETYKLYNIFNHSLLFSPNKGDVIKDKNQKITNFLYYNEGNYLNSIFECNKREIPIITYSGSSIGTGANFPDRHTVIIDSKYRCNPQGLNNSMLKVAQDISEVSHLSGNEQMKQNVGRILRVDLKEPVLTKTIVLNNVDFDCEYFKELCEKLEVYEIDVCRVELDKTVNYELYSLCSLISDGLKSPGKYDIFDKNIHNDVYFANKIIDGDLTAFDVVYETDNSKNKNPTLPSSTPDEFKIALHIHKNGFPNNIKEDLCDVVKGLTHSKKLKEITEFINTLKKGRTK
jgi:hypothetical protein